jgi:hypothetical protein
MAMLSAITSEVSRLNEIKKINLWICASMKWLARALCETENISVLQVSDFGFDQMSSEPIATVAH